MVTCVGWERPPGLSYSTILWYEVHRWKRSKWCSMRSCGRPPILPQKRQKMNRSALIRHALQEHLARLRALELEERDRCGYMAQPQRDRAFRVWEEAAAWPEQ